MKLTAENLARTLAAALAVLALSPLAQAQENESFPLFRSNVKGFTTYNQYQSFENVQTTTPYWRKEGDLNLLSVKGEYYLSRVAELEFEVEFEHGGVGTTLEYDPLAEFGEFEKELEQGGEVALTELYYRRLVGPLFWIRAGKIPVYASLGSVQENLLLYPTIFQSRGEAYMLPAEWREVGVEALKRFGNYGARLSVTNGLNSEFFRKYNWVGGGYQRKFETINAENLAATLSLEMGDVSIDDGVVISGYYGNTSGNRFKRNKMKTDSPLTILSAFGSYHFGDFGIRGQFVRGSLDHSDEVSLANSSLPSSANPGSFSSIGHQAQLEMLELSYKVLKNDESSLTGFVSYEHVDTFSDTEGSILKDDRYNQLFTSVGLMWVFDQVMFLKGAYTKHSTSLTGLPDTNEYRVALGFDLQGFNQ